MTDQIPRASKKVEPCAWCGKEPMVYGGSDDYVRAWCDPHACRMQSFNDLPLEDWNAGQATILAQRRKDFEAGRWIEQGCGLVFTDFEHYMRHAKELEKNGN